MIRVHTIVLMAYSAVHNEALEDIAWRHSDSMRMLKEDRSRGIVTSSFSFWYDSTVHTKT